VENVYIIFQQIYSENGAPNFIKIAEFYERYYKKHFGLFFPDTVQYNVLWFT